jgi:hypothetical protein
MAYKICQFVATLNLSSMTASRGNTFANPNTNQLFILPEMENKLIKKISVDCVYNSSGDLVLVDYSLQIGLININQTLLTPNFCNIVNPTNFITNENFYSINFFKENNIRNINLKAGGFRIGTPGYRSTKVVLSNSITPISSNVSFLITFYYV